MNPSLEEMKLAVAGMLPGVLSIRSGQVYREADQTNLLGIPTRIRVMETEWLHVCRLVLKLIGAKFRMRVHARLTHNMKCPVTGYDPCSWDVAFAPVEEILKAICQVQFPKMFQTQEAAA